jgi:plasmid stabilization system protein ParE
VKLQFTAKALDDLARLHQFVAEKNPAAADRIRDQLLGSFQSLLEQPMSGQSALGHRTVQARSRGSASLSVVDD